MKIYQILLLLGFILFLVGVFMFGFSSKRAEENVDLDPTYQEKIKQLDSSFIDQVERADSVITWQNKVIELQEIILNRQRKSIEDAKKGAISWEEAIQINEEAVQEMKGLRHKNKIQ